MAKSAGIVGIIALVVCSSLGFQRASPPEPSPTFYKDVLPVLHDHCQSCHRPGEVAPMPLVTYEQTRPWANAIGHAVQMKMMPPWFADSRFGHFANDPSLTEQQISMISAWVAAGMPAGNSLDAPPAKEWAKGWNIAQTDLVVGMTKSIQLNTHGEVDYTD